MNDFIKNHAKNNSLSNGSLSDLQLCLDSWLSFSTTDVKLTGQLFSGSGYSLRLIQQRGF